MLQASSFRILNCYISGNTLGFAEICRQTGYPTDLGGYYLRRLVKDGYIEKAGRGQYTISAAGGKQQLSLRYGKAPFYLRPRMVVLLVVSKGDKYVVLRRSNQPFIGTAERPASDVKIGEPLSIASTSTLQERLGIIGEPKFQGFFRRIDTYKDMLFDDKIFAVHAYTLGEKDTINERGSTLNAHMKPNTLLP